MDFSAFTRFSRTYKQGEIIFSEHEPGSTFYVIQSGRVKLYKVIGEIERVLDVLSPPNSFGEMAILDDSPRSATAIAVDDEVKLLEFNSQNFEILLLGNPQIALRILRTFARKIHDSRRRSLILALQEPQARIADVFLMLDETSLTIDKTSERREFKINMEDVAHWAGMSIYDTKNILNNFIAQRRIEINDDYIAVKNINDFSRFVSSRRRREGR